MPFCDALIAKYVHPSLLTHPNTTGLLDWVESSLFQKAFMSTLSTLNPDRIHLDHSIWHLIKIWCTQLLFHVWPFIFVSFRTQCMKGKGSYGVVRGSPRLGSRMLFSTCLLIIFIQSTNIDWSLPLCQALLCVCQWKIILTIFSKDWQPQLGSTSSPHSYSRELGFK